MRARVCVIHWHCSAQLSMFNMEKRYRNKIIIIIIIMKQFGKTVCNAQCPKFLATQDGWPAGRTNLTHYIDPCDFHVDQQADLHARNRCTMTIPAIIVCLRELEIDHDHCNTSTGCSPSITSPNTSIASTTYHTF